MDASPSTDRVALVTGGSGGIGRVSAAALAAQGFEVVIVARGSGRGAAVAEELRGGGASAHFLAADLGSMQEVRRAVAEFRERWSRLDVLMLNAGAYFHRRQVSVEGFEATWALNHLGVALPALMLADLLVASAPARVVITSSNAAMATRMHWDDLQRERYSAMGAYAQSKLANQVFTLALAERLQGRGVSVHAMHPGFVATDFAGEAGPLARWVRLGQRLFGRTPEQGADTLTFLATDPIALQSTGGYWVDRRARTMAPGAREEGAAERLWRATLEQLQLSEGDLPEVLRSA